MGYKTIDEMIDSIKDYSRNLQSPASGNYHIHSQYLIDGMDELAFEETFF